jgi:hypothetical protein
MPAHHGEDIDMRYMVRFEVSIEAGSKIDRSNGGADPVIGKLLELLKPETFYVSIFKRELFVIVNTEDTALLSEAAHLIHLIGGTNAEVTPIMTPNETMAILPGAIGNAVKTAVSLGL